MPRLSMMAFKTVNMFNIEVNYQQFMLIQRPSFLLHLGYSKVDYSKYGFAVYYNLIL